jgi:hypothetical protein
MSWIFLCLLFELGNEGSKFPSKTCVVFHWTIQNHITEDRNIQLFIKKDVMAEY